jgi:hypothetical protein
MRNCNLVLLFGSLLISRFVSASVFTQLPLFNKILTNPRARVPSQFYNASVPRWEWWPNSGQLTNGDKGQYLNLSSGVDLWYTTFGKNSSRHTPVLLLHGGTGNSNQMYNQANKLAETRQVILQEYIFSSSENKLAANKLS